MALTFLGDWCHPSAEITCLKYSTKLLRICTSPGWPSSHTLWAFSTQAAQGFPPKYSWLQWYQHFFHHQETSVPQFPTTTSPPFVTTGAVDPNQVGTWPNTGPYQWRHGIMWAPAFWHLSDGLDFLGRSVPSFCRNKMSQILHKASEEFALLLVDLQAILFKPFQHCHELLKVFPWIAAGYNDIILIVENPWDALQDMVHSLLPDGWCQSHTIG